MPAHTAAVHRDPSHGRARLPILIAALLLIAFMAFIGSGIAGTAQAQAERGAIPSLNLASSEPGQLVITWETPDPAPTDYRISWAQASLGYLSYRDANEAQRGNVYPLGGATTLTLNNLTPGDDYKVQIRSRYYNADRSVHESSGPWTATAATRVMDEPAEPPQSGEQTGNEDPPATPQPTDQTGNDGPPAAPTGLTASPVEHDSLTLTWEDPQDARITGYRVMRGPNAGSLSTIEADTGSASTEYADDTVAAETIYHYAVIALSNDGDGAQSSAISATTPAAPKSEDQTRNDDPPATPKSKEPPGRVGPRQSNTQTALVLVSNIGQSGDTTGFTQSFDFAQPFMMGSFTDGYTLDSIHIRLLTLSSTLATTTPTLTLHTVSGTGTKVADLTGPAALTRSTTKNYEFRPAGTVTLEASTEYWLVVDGGRAGVFVQYTGSDSEDATPLDGATIGNAAYKRSASSTGSFSEVAGTPSLKIRVDGVRANAVAMGAPAITAPNVFRVPAVLGVDLSGITDANGVTGIPTNATYKWQRFAANGTTLEADSIGTSSTYTLTDADEGKTLKVVVNYTDDGGYSEGPLTSAATSAITAAASCAAPTLTGEATVLGSARKVGVGKYSVGTPVYYGFSKTMSAGSLDSAMFTTAGSYVYEIETLATSNGVVAVQLDQKLVAADSSTVVLHVCDQAYEFRTPVEPTFDPPIYLFTMSGQDWSAHAERTIYLSQVPPPVTLVSNLSQTANQNATYSRDHGQAFTTGSNTNGYTVTSVTIVSQDPNSDAIPLQVCEVDGSVHPTTVCTDLTPPSSYPQGSLTYTVPTTTPLTLDADTTYMLVFKAPQSPTVLRVAATSSDSEDSTSLAGFSIANVFQWYNNSNTWVIANGGRAIRITITGRANTATGPEVTVSFPPFAYTVREGETVSVPVNLSVDPERTVIIPIMASGLNGATAEDYTVPASVTFNAGRRSRTITLSAIDDGVNDNDGESVLLSFGTLPSRVSAGAIISLTIPISDNDRLNPNNPPTASNGTVTQREDWRYTFKATDFDYSDAENDAFDHLKITELPA